MLNDKEHNPDIKFRLFRLNLLKYIIFITVLYVLDMTLIFSQGYNVQKITQPNTRQIYSTVVDSKGNIYTGTRGAGVWKSSDNGNSWSAENSGLKSYDIRKIVVTPSDRLFAATENGLFTSTNGGDSWSFFNDLTSVSIKSIVSNDQNTYALSDNGQLYYSNTNGNSWIKKNQIPEKASFASMIIDNNNRIFIGTDNGIYRSSDNGSTFESAGNELSDAIITGLVISKTENIVAATENRGIYLSTDNGSNWRQINSGLVDLRIRSITIDPNGTMYAGTFSKGVYRSSDNGNSWKEINIGISDPKIEFLIADPVNKQLISGTDMGKIYYSTNNGDAWSSRDKNLICIRPSNINIIVKAGTQKEKSFIPPQPEIMKKVLSGNKSINLKITYNNFTPEAKAAFDYAMSIWSSSITSSVPIYVTANYSALQSNVLAIETTSQLAANFPNAPQADVLYPIPLAEKLAGSAVNQDSVADITVTFNNSISWYFGTDGNTPFLKYDFVTVVLHEFCHGLGYFSTMAYSNGAGSYGLSGNPSIFDKFLSNNMNQQLVNTTLFPNPSTALGSQLVGDNIFWSGQNRGLNGWPKMYAPNPWEDGSSTSHLNLNTYSAKSGNGMMIPYQANGDAIHDPGPIVMAQLKDMGWGTSVPNTVFISGTIKTASGTPISGVTVNLTGSSTNSATTDSTGSYSFEWLTSGGNYTVTPVKTGYTFTPSSATFNNLTLVTLRDFTGLAGAAAISVSPTSLSFGNVAISTNSDKTITISNTGTTSLAISGLAITGTNNSAFTIVGATLPINIAAGANQTITIRYSPTASGSNSANLQITHNAAGSPTTVPLSGTGTAPVIGLNPTSLDYGNATVNTNSDKTITISNTGNATLTITNLSFSGTNSSMFSAIGVTLPVNIAAGANQTITIRLTPTASGAISANLQITHNATGSPSSVTLTGTGTAPLISVSPTSLSYGSVTVNTNSDKTITISNTGNATLTISNLSFSGTDNTSFTTVGVTLPVNIAAGANQTITIRFTPTTTGSKSASLQITHNATGSPTSVSLSGTGTAAPTPVISLDNASLNFGSTTINTTNDKTLTISNTGTAILTITGMSITGIDNNQFSYPAVTFPFNIAAGGNQTITIHFAPTSTGSKSASLQIVHNAAGSPTNVSLSGIGSAIPTPSISLSPSSIDYGNIIVGLFSDKNITITNSGTATLTISSLSIIGSDNSLFTYSGLTLPVDIPAGGNQTVTVRFGPTSTGSKSAVLQITHNAGGSPSSVPLVGTGIQASADYTIAFGNVNVNTSKDTTFLIPNTSLSTMIISDLFFSDGDSSMFKCPQASKLPISVPVGSIATLTINFTPSSSGNKATNFLITTSQRQLPYKVLITGTGVDVPTISISQSSISFGKVNLSSLIDQPLTIKNDGSKDLVISKIEFSGQDPLMFKLSNPDSVKIPITITAKSSLTLNVRFNPTSAGDKTSDMVITHNASGSPTTIKLTGTGISSSIILSSNNIDFGNVKVSESKNIPLTINNKGTTALQILSLNVSGTNANLFTLDKAAPFSINPSDSQKITIKFSPIDLTTANAALTIVSNDAVNPTITVPLTGKGQKPVLAPLDSLIDFGKVNVSNTGTKTITLKNTSQYASLKIETVAFESDTDQVFSFSTQIIPPLIINPSSSINLGLVFTPKTRKNYTANLLLISSDLGVSFRIKLIASGGGPNIVFLNDSLNFGRVPYEESRVGSFIFQNTGDGDLIINKIELQSGQINNFALTYDPTNKAIAPGLKDSIQIKLLDGKSNTNLLRVQLAITTNNLPNNVIQKNALAIKIYPKIVFPSALNIGKIKVDSSATNNITISNTGESNLNIKKIELSGTDVSEFEKTTISPTPFLIEPGKLIPITIKFSPKKVGIKDAKLNISSNDTSYSEATIVLNAEGTKQNLVSSVNNIDFGKMSISFTKDSTFTLQNQGTGSVTVSSMVLRGADSSQFGFKNFDPTQSFTMNANDLKSFKLQFKPFTGGTKTASLEITSSDQLNPKITINLTGSAITPTLSSNITAIDFSNVRVNTTKDSVIVIMNKGEGTLQINGIGISGQNQDNFSVVSGSPLPIAVYSNGQYSTTIRFKPSSVGDKAANVIFTSTDLKNPSYTVALKGKGINPQIGLSAQSIDFGLILVKKLKDITFNIYNNGSDRLLIKRIFLNGGDSSIFKTLSSVYPVLNNIGVDPGQSITITSRFAPIDEGKKTAKITIESDDPGTSSTDISLSAEGVIPFIVLETDSIAEINKDKQIQFHLSLNIQPVSAKIFFRNGGTANYDSSSMTGSAPTYSYTFPQNNINQMGKDYYFKATWDNGVQRTLPVTNYTTSPLSLQINYKTINNPNGQVAKTHSQISVPFLFRESSFLQEIIRNLGPINSSSWRIFKWRNNDYEEYLDETQWQLKAGDGFWLVSKDNQTLDFQNCLTVPTNAPYKITLLPGWNQIGNPFLFPITLASINRNGKNVENKVWEWLPDDKTYNDLVASGRPLDIWTGYFIKNLEPNNVDIFINPIFYQAGMNKTAGIESPTLQKGEWKLTISLSSKINGKFFMNNESEIGTLISSSDEWDLNDASEPPPSPEKYISVRFVHSNWKQYNGNYVRDFRSISIDGKTWDMEIANSTEIKEYELQLIKNGSLPDEFQINLFDYDLNKNISYNTGETYNFKFGDNQQIKKIRISIGTKEYIEKDNLAQKSIITDYSLSQNYPNPFNPSTNIGFRIADPELVTIKVYDIIGREIVTLINKELKPGEYSVVFDAKALPSGIYYYRLQAGNYSNIKKMLYIR